MRIVAFLGAAGAAAAVGSASGQTFGNGDFESGSLSPWVVVDTANGQGAPGTVGPIDIDGPGPLGTSQAAIFSVGQVSFSFGDQEGIEMTQTLNLTAGTQYTFDCDWSAQRDSTVQNAEGGVFNFIADGVVIATQAAGPITMAAPAYGHLNANYSTNTTGPHVLGLRITRPWLGGGGASDVRQYVDNVRLSGGTAQCYANCDNSTTPPILNVNDFVCFQTAFAAGSSYANCDHSTTPPVLNVNDFVCFQTAFAAGCP